MKIILMIGAPGSGKGTQAKKIAEEYGYIHISTGDLFRERAKVVDELGLKIKGLIESGALVPDDITVQTFEETVKKNSNAKGLIFDGFPRNLQQVIHFEKIIEDNLPGAERNIIFLNVSGEELVERILKRSAIENRVDDTSEKIKTRLAIYNENTIPVILYYQKMDSFQTFTGTGKTPDDVWSEVEKIIAS